MPCRMTKSAGSPTAGVSDFGAELSPIATFAVIVTDSYRCRRDGDGIDQETNCSPARTGYFSALLFGI